jgi:pyridoxal phosphate enzyme (YggS family)
VTKFADIAHIKEAIGLGVTHVAENKVQEARKKFLSLKDSPLKVTKHMIGHLQTNKVKQALEIFDCIQSVDSLKLALALEKQAAKINKHIDVFVQVNTAGEKQKYGITPSALLPLIGKIIKLEHVHLRGLMVIAPLTKDEAVIRQCFRDLRVLRDQANAQFSEDGLEIKYLSMGMTDDYEIALEEGSNMVRIGRAIFSGQ